MLGGHADRLNGFFSPLGFCFTKHTLYTHDLPAKIRWMPEATCMAFLMPEHSVPGTRVDQTPSPEFSFETLRS